MCNFRMMVTVGWMQQRLPSWHIVSTFCFFPPPTEFSFACLPLTSPSHVDCITNRSQYRDCPLVTWRAISAQLAFPNWLVLNTQHDSRAGHVHCVCAPRGWWFLFCLKLNMKYVLGGASSLSEQLLPCSRLRMWLCTFFDTRRTTLSLV